MCAFKDELKDREERDDEPTEITAMTPSSLDADLIATPTSSATIQHNTVSWRHRRKTWLKRLLSSASGKCILGLTGLAPYLVAKLVIGSFYITDCPLDAFLPIYIVMSSVIFTVFIILFIIVFYKCRKKESEDEDDDNSLSVNHAVALVYYFIHLVFQLAGTICVIRTKLDVDKMPTEEEGDAACNPTLLDFAFGTVIFESIVSSIGLLLSLMILCQVIYVVCCREGPRKPPSQP